MRELTQQEINDAPDWANFYSIQKDKPYFTELAMDQRELDFKPVPRKEFDIDISFTKSEIENLIGQLDGIEDCGPRGEGWTSDELLGLLTKLNNALEDLK